MAKRLRSRAGDGIQMQVAFAHSVSNLSPVLWDAPMCDGQNTIEYDSKTGAFRLAETGLYYVAWWLLAKNTAPLGTRFFAEITDAESLPQTVPAASCNGGRLSGQALFHIKHAPATLRLINASGGTVVYGEQLPKADIVIVRV